MNEEYEMTKRGKVIMLTLDAAVFWSGFNIVACACGVITLIEWLYISYQIILCSILIGMLIVAFSETVRLLCQHESSTANDESDIINRLGFHACQVEGGG